MAQQKKAFKKWLQVVLSLVICGSAMQLIRPNIDNPPVTKDINVPYEVKKILRRDCYDCHSNETQLLWFDKLTPANYFVASDINEGRKVLNFSHWDSVSKEQGIGKLFESLNQATFGTMPIDNYIYFHPNARISDQDLLVLRKYLISQIPLIIQDLANITRDSTYNRQYSKWLVTPARSAEVQKALNGITFRSDYKNWEVISTTERWDNATMRVIFGNEIAIKAIKLKQTNPWPDGTAFAKAAWDQIIDSSGEIHAGAFKQVEFII